MKLIILLAMAGIAAGQAFGGDPHWHPSGPCSLSKDKDIIASDGSAWHCADQWNRKPFLYSAAFLASSQLTDALSSRNRDELNPILGRSPFGARQETIKASALGAVLLAEWLIVRHHPEWRRGFMWANYLSGGVTFAVAAHNYSER